MGKGNNKMNIGDIFTIELYDEAFDFVSKNKGTTIQEIESKLEDVTKTRQVEKTDSKGNPYFEEENYTEKELVRYFQIVELPKPSLQELKEAKREEINADREVARKTEGAEYDGDIFDVDETSQSNILAQIKVAELLKDTEATYIYRSKTNTDHLLNVTELQELGLSIAKKVNAIYAKSWELKAKVDSATTAEEVEEIKWILE